ncbi:MAG: GNAT family N-acetyltransferase [Terrimicrobiaceae bacterium]
MHPSSPQPSSLNSQPPPLTIRPINATDWPAVDRIQLAAFAPEVIEELTVFASFAALSPTTCLLAIADEEAIGYLLAHPWIPDDLPPLNTALDRLPERSTSLFIHDLALLPDRRGRGAARDLVHAAFAAGKSLGLAQASLLSVQGSESFWQRQGFLPRLDLERHIARTVRLFTTIDFLFMTRPNLGEVEG